MNQPLLLRHDNENAHVAFPVADIDDETVLSIVALPMFGMALNCILDKIFQEMFCSGKKDTRSIA